jgi:protein-glutamine gamma-glutamyltransferase-like protein
MQAGICISISCGADIISGGAQLRAEWSRLGIESHVESVEQTRSSGTCLLLRLAEQSAHGLMPGFDTLGLAATLKLEVSHQDDDLLHEIWLTLLNSPVLLEFPSVEELMAAVRVRRNIVRNAERTCLNFHTSAIERPEDCWRYAEETGFVLTPGSPLIESLKKACQPEITGQLYSFSCYRATEYVILLAIAEEAREHHPELLRQLQIRWEKKAISSGLFHEVFMHEVGTLEEPLPIHYYVPGDRVWFRNPDPHSSDVPGFEGSWVYYLGGGMFANFWKRERPFTLLAKCLEIHHWRESFFRDAQGDLQMDETKVEQLVAQTLADPEATARIFARMHRLRDAQGVYAEGGCMDATREAPKFVLAPHSDLIRALTAS